MKNNNLQQVVSEIPEDWNLTNVGSLVSTISKTFDFSKSDEVVFLNTSDVLEGKVLLHDKISKIGLPGQAKKSIQKGDILFSEIRPKNKRFAYVDFEAEDYVVSTKLMVLRTNGKVSPKYLFFYLTSDPILDRLQLLAESRSGTFPQITFSEVSSLDITLPSLPTQNQIANFIEALDGKLELNRRMNKTLEEMGKALFKRWFVDFEFPNENGKPYKSSGGGMADSELGEIPQGWKIKDLGEIFEINTKSINPSKHPDQVFWHFSIPSYDQYGSPTLEAGITIKSNKTQIKNRSLLVSKLNPKQEERVWSVYADSWGGNAISSTEFINFVPDGKDWAFANFLFRNDDFYNRFADMSTGSTGSRQRVRPTEAKRLNFVYPSEHLRLQFTNIIDPILVEIDKNVRETMVLKELRDSLLPRLMSGKLKI